MGPDEIRAVTLAYSKRWNRPLSIHKVLAANPNKNRYAFEEFLALYREVADAILLDTSKPGGSGRTHDWKLARAIVEASELPVILAGGLTSENLGQAVAQVHPFGLDVETGISRLEGARKRIDLARAALFIDAARQSEAQHGYL
jgi:phosphoribosylanthranilate isomerase